MKKFAMVLGVGLTLTAATKPAPSLKSYVGKYPSDKGANISFLKHPTVRAAVSGAAPNLSVRTTVLTSGVEGPIDRQGSLIVATMCEPHNCSSHQWTIAILSPRGPAAICYHDSDLMGEVGRWFIGGTAVARTQGCWSGEHTEIPDAVVARLVKGL
jgi:hypothetical protein